MSLADKQEAEIVRIQRCQNHYEVLDVPRTADDEEIKAASRRILRLIHPDRNNHPEANEVTQRVNRAVEVLADKFQRLIYNITLDREPLQDETTESETEEPDVPPEAPPFEREWFFDAPRPQEAKNNHNVYVSLLIVVLAIVALVYLGTSRDPLYSLHRTEVHQVLKRTAKHGIEYFLKPEVTRRSSAVFRQIEKSIEEEFFVKLKDSCLEQVNNRDWMMWQARNFGDRMLFKEAHYMKMRDCERVRAWDA
ncbi:unnamed protein product [Tenebrio molitor]|nr:unnamed protein product [Tenebrio molitor]